MSLISTYPAPSRASKVHANNTFIDNLGRRVHLVDVMPIREHKTGAMGVIGPNGVHVDLQWRTDNLPGETFYTTATIALPFEMVTGEAPNARCCR